MKKFFAMAIAMVVAFSANAQIQKGEKIVSVGVGLGNNVYPASSYEKSLVPINADFEMGVVEGLLGVDKLSLGVGGTIGYTQAKNDYSQYLPGSNIGYKFSYVNIGAKGYFHYDLDVENLDVYAALTLGYDIASAKVYGDWNDFDMDMDVDAEGGLSLGVSVGARYWFLDNLAASMEVGTGLSILKLGVSYRF